MPRIAAPTVAEHREQVRSALVDAAERMLRDGEKLTAGAVSAAAGIARNSIYRYVDSVDDLHGMVLQRYLPGWDHAVTAVLQDIDDPQRRLVEWVRVNLEQASVMGHGWLMEIGRSGAGTSPAAAAVADHAHRILRDWVGDAWAALVPDAEDARLYAFLTLGLLRAAFDQLDSGVDLERVVSAATLATDALVASAVAASA